MNIDFKKLPGNLYQNINLLNIILALTVISVTFIIYYYNTRDIQLKIAYRGFGPHDYVNQKLNPHNFEKNWDSGIMNYDYSLPMKIYYYLAKYCDISPSTTIYPFMFIQTILFLFSIGFLTQTLFRNRLITIVSIIIIPLTNLAGLNLSRFGNGFGSYLSFPLYYGYSNAFRIFSLGFFLKNKYILMFIFLALSIYCHVSMGLFAMAFIGGYLLYKPTLFREKYLQIGGLIFLVLLLPHIYSISCNSTVFSAGISVDQWVKSTRIFSFHWYPITMRLFTRNAHNLFFPLLLLCFFFFVTLRYQDIKDEKNVKILSGTIVCMILCVLGIIFSDIYPIPFLIKISLQRSTGLITFLGVLYIIYYLFKKIENGKMFNIFLAIYSLLLLVFAKPGIAVLPLFLLLYSDIREGHFGSLKIESYNISIRKSFYFIMAFLLLMLTLTCIFQNNHKIANSIFGYLWTPLQYFNPFNEPDFLLRGGKFKITLVSIYSVVSSSLIIAYKNSIRKNKTVNILFIKIFFVISLSMVWYHERDQYLGWHNSYSKIASSYLDVQLWAKDNTPTDALFMPDPSHYYGWRDFSERSSFGNLREWGYSSIAYNPDQKVFVEGLRRIKELGVDISKITMDDIKSSTSVPYFYKFDNVRKNYNNISDSQLQKLSSKNEIDYFIFNKGHLQRSLQKLFKKFRIAYSNDNFFVFTNGKQESFFEGTFSNWDGKDTISMLELPETAAPLVLQGFRGDFNFSCFPEYGGNVIRVFPLKNGKKDDLVVQFGYSLNKNGFDLEIFPGQEVIFIVSARLSNKTKNPTAIFIQDKVETWNKESKIINKTSWEEYVISKRIRPGYSELLLGINWKPQSKDQWLEIKNISVIVIK